MEMYLFHNVVLPYAIVRSLHVHLQTGFYNLVSMEINDVVEDYFNRHSSLVHLLESSRQNLRLKSNIQ